MEQRPVPVNKKDESILHLEFKNIRELFEKEMQRMDEEMNKFFNAISTLNPGKQDIFVNYNIFKLIFPNRVLQKLAVHLK